MISYNIDLYNITQEETIKTNLGGTPRSFELKSVICEQFDDPARYECWQDPAHGDDLICKITRPHRDIIPSARDVIRCDISSGGFFETRMIESSAPPI